MIDDRCPTTHCHVPVSSATMLTRSSVSKRLSSSERRTDRCWRSASSAFTRGADGDSTGGGAPASPSTGSDSSTPGGRGVTRLASSNVSTRCPVGSMGVSMVDGRRSSFCWPAVSSMLLLLRLMLPARLVFDVLQAIWVPLLLVATGTA